MYADVTLQIAGSPSALTIPVQALDQGSNGTSVLVVDGSNEVQRRAVRVGLTTPDKVQILDGVHEGEQVIVGNLASYEPGQKVNPRTSAMVVSGKED
jgi:multidrug efflux pump subunit AcrA (membrane-fusion protein)